MTRHGVSWRKLQAESTASLDWPFELVVAPIQTSAELPFAANIPVSVVEHRLRDSNRTVYIAKALATVG
jgi:hypothetical protein